MTGSRCRAALLYLKEAAGLVFVALCLLLPTTARAADPPPDATRVALVIGNAKYPQTPLLNPVNDAEAVAGLLQRAGFIVDKRTDAARQDLQQAVSQFAALIGDSKVKFALFYYAGHGVQIDWRNYLIPVNASVRSADDVRAQTVDVSDLLRQMQQMPGKSFLVILDACRDNPFGAKYRPAAKGLSPFEAPAGSLLAFSTAPGKVALDGEGRHGLYTSHLLRELEVPGARVEDAFKRVRLNVRLDSRGQQVPWESTSLEDDVYLFPTARQQLTEAQRESRLTEELSYWGQVRASTDIDLLANFIRQFPSGSTSELAQARLNRMLRAREETMRQQALALRYAEEKRVAQAQQDAQPSRLDDGAGQAAVQLALASRDTGPVALAQRDAGSQSKHSTAQISPVTQRIAETQPQAQAALGDDQPALRLSLPQAGSEKLASSALPLPPVSPEPSTEPANPATLDPTPFYPGYHEHRRSYKLGDEFEFRIVDGFSGREIPREASGVRTPLNLRVTRVDTSGDRVEFNSGEYVSDLMGNTLKHLTGVFSEPRQFYPSEFFIGKRWKSEFRQDRFNGLSYTFRFTLRVVAREKITVPAGTFDAWRIESEGFNIQLGARQTNKIWVVPGINADIANETQVRLSNGRITQFDRQELVKFPAPVAL